MIINDDNENINDDNEKFSIKFMMSIDIVSKHFIYKESICRGSLIIDNSHFFLRY